MIQHFTEAGRRVYTLSEAAELLHGDDEQAGRRWIEATRRRLNRQGVPKAGEINPREPVYYPEDLGVQPVKEIDWPTVAALLIEYADLSDGCNAELALPESVRAAVDDAAARLPKFDSHIELAAWARDLGVQP